MKRKILLCLFLSTLFILSNAQTWDYKSISKDFEWMDMSDSTYFRSPCDNCMSYYEFPEGFTFYDNDIDYIYFSTNGFIEINNYVNTGTYFGGNIPIGSPYYSFLSFGGNTNGRTTDYTYYKIFGEAPNRVITFQTTFQTGSTATDYEADIQVSFYEKTRGIQFSYMNVAGSTNQAEYIGLNQGNTVNYTLIDDTTGGFPIKDTTYLFVPDISEEISIMEVADLSNCELTASEQITATLFNSGLDTLINLPIFLISKGDTLCKDTIKDKIAYTDEYMHTFSQSVDLSADGIYSYVASVELSDLYDDNSLGFLIHNYVSPIVEDTNACYGESGSLTASGGDYYSWHDMDDTDYALFMGSEPFTTPPLFLPATYGVKAYKNGIFLQSFSSNDTYVNHDPASGDDRAGIAVTPDYLYIVGDDNTVRMNAEDLTDQVSLPIRDGIFSDLSTGKLYELYSTVDDGNLYDVGTPFYIDAIVEMNKDLEYVDTIMLSDTIRFTDYNWEGGIFPGAGIVLVKDGEYGNLYQINIAEATVDSLGIYEDLEGDWYSENYAQWGFTESYDNEVISVIFPWGDNEIRRIDIASKEVSILGVITRLDDLHSITYSPWHNRIYFHSETDDEDGGYVSAVSRIGGECIASMNVAITPQAYAGLNSSNELCNTETAANLLSYINGSPQSGGMWADDDNTGAVSNGVLDASGLSDGTYDFTYTVEATGACSTDDAKTLTLDIYEAANAGSGTNTTLSKEATTIYNLFEALDGNQDITGYWKDDDATGVLSGSIINISTLAAGDYDFSYVAFGDGPCGDDMVTITITILESSSIHNVTGENIALYPNPVNDFLYIEINKSTEDTYVELIDVSGQVVLNEQLTNNRLDLSGLHSGLYILKIKNDNNNYVTQIVIE